MSITFLKFYSSQSAVLRVMLQFIDLLYYKINQHQNSVIYVSTYIRESYADGLLYHVEITSPISRTFRNKTGMQLE